MTDTEKWQAVSANDKLYDGRFFYAVQSTGVFCRPSCASRPPLRENVVFFDTAQQAMSAGYRPCKRCRPDLPEHQPEWEVAQRMKAVMDSLYGERSVLAEALAQLGVSGRRAAEIFRAQMGLTPGEYADSLRIRAATERLAGGDADISGIALALGFDSLSSFYGFFRRHTQMTPGEYRRFHQDDGAPSGGVCRVYDLPLGPVAIAADAGGVTSVRLADSAGWPGAQAGSPETDRAARQLEEYFAGRCRTFELRLNPAGTPFQQSVWAALRTIPYGRTMSYKQVAALIGNPGASRAVGMANNKNPLLIVVPCHRVVGADGTLVGYAAGLDVKKRLLELERANLDGEAGATAFSV